MSTAMADILALTDIDPTMITAVGGKATGLAELIKMGERVPDGFCLTTQVFHSGSIPMAEVLDAYDRLGSGPVAVRSSATAEDLPDASFAGQQETVLNVEGHRELQAAIQTCWESLYSDRAVAYRDAAVNSDDEPEMAVVVQRMVQPEVAGVMFTANPITGTRDQIVVNAAPGLGTAVVDGTVAADQYVVDKETPTTPSGCLTREQLDLLCAAGRRIQQRAGSPQDIEWAIDTDGELWLLQSRPITTLFPLPETDAAPPRVYFEVGHMQGMLRPFTPMGMAALLSAAAGFMGPNDQQVRSGIFGIVNIAGRMYLDLTASVRDKTIRKRLPQGMAIYGPAVSSAMTRVLDDPRFAPIPGRLLSPRAAAGLALRYGPRVIGGLAGALARPAAARERMFRLADEVAHQVPDEGARTATAHIRLAEHLQDPFMKGTMMQVMGPLYAGLLARPIAAALLKGVATAAEVDTTQGGMPHNNTTDMDLSLWRIAAAAGDHRDLLQNTEPAVLAQRYLAGELPDIGLDEFLRRFGRRGAAEIDVGVDRWREDPTPVFAAVRGYLQVSTSEQAPDRRFAQAAVDAESMIKTLESRARRSRPVRARLAGFFLRRSRALAGLRELPKFLWLQPLGEVRRHLLLAGGQLVEQGVFQEADDIMFLDFDEAVDAADGRNVTDLVTRRRADYERENRRRTVPGLMLSDGTIPAAMAPSEPIDDGVLAGMAASAGTVTGPARVILDPSGARIEPGDILVAPTTDPGWTPLFMTAGGLVTETGSPMAHGPTVAREYGIPAVICVAGATQLIRTGQVITVEGAAGTVRIHETSDVSADSHRGDVDC